MRRNNFLRNIIVVLMVISSASGCDVLTKSKEAVFNRYSISNQSMSPTLAFGKSYTLTAVDSFKRNQIVSFFAPREFWERNENMISILRLVALPGDTVEMKHGELLINNAPYPYDVELKNEYSMVVTKPVDEKLLEGLEFHITGRNTYKLFATARQMSLLAKKISDTTVNLEILQPDKVENETLRVPGNNRDNWGPVRVPKKGDRVVVTAKNRRWYSMLTSQDDVQLSSLTITVNRDYFFMLGDNRHNAFDSRYMGFIPDNDMEGAMKELAVKTN